MFEFKLAKIKPHVSYKFKCKKNIFREKLFKFFIFFYHVQILDRLSDYKKILIKENLHIEKF